MRSLTAVESVLQLESVAASSCEGSLMSSERLVYRSRVCRLTRERKAECLTAAISHVHLVKGLPRRRFERRVLEVKNKNKSAFCFSHVNQAAEQVDSAREIAARE